MKIFASKLINSSVYSSDKVGSVAKIKFVLVDGNTGVVLAVAVNRSKSKLVGFHDLLWNQSKKCFYLRNLDAIVDREDLVLASRVIDNGLYFNKQKIVTEDDKFVGKLVDFEIDTNLGVLTKILTKRRFVFFSTQRIFARKHIVEVFAEKIIVKSDMNFSIQTTKKAAPALAGPLS